MLKIILLLSLIGGARCYFWNTSTVNKWADDLIESVVYNIRSTDSEYIPVPELQQEVVNHVGKIPVKIGILATEGVLGELTSLKRTADVKISEISGLAFVYLPITLDRIGVHFDVCIVRCGSAKAFDELEIKVPVYKKISVQARFSVKTEGKCTAVLDSIRINTIKNLEILFTELCIGVASQQLSEWINNYFNNKIIYSLETKYNSIISEELKTHDFCRNIN